MIRSSALTAVIALSLAVPIASAQTSVPSPSAAPAATAVAPSASSDPNVWLEDAHGARAMSWVRAQNARTLGILQADPRFASIDRQTLRINEASDRIANPTFVAGNIYNFWQDAAHVRGIWRFTSAADYARSTPHWHTALDLDALARREHANWVWEGASCTWPSDRRCLISLSDGGEDAVTVREFDLTNDAFVSDGFKLPHGKQSATYETPDSILVAREWLPGELTTSGYPYVLKRLRRGQPLASATEIFHGRTSDVSVNASVYRDDAGDDVTIIGRGVTFFTSEYYLLTVHGARRIAIPAKSNPLDVVAGRMLFALDEPWLTGGRTYPQGAVVSVSVAALEADPGHLQPALVYVPGPRDSFGDEATTRDRLIVTTYHDVRGRAYVYTPASNGGWSRRDLALPDDSSIGNAQGDPHGDAAFLTVTGFLSPTTLWRADARTATASVEKALPARFDASRDTVDQYEAVSTDGTRVPYFVVHPKTMRLDGGNPTILYAYGGFQISMTPSYAPVLGKEWLDRGGVYVLANIRGGGEFGPAWHEAGLKTHRQRIYDDFASVARDLVARKITDARHLGIEGGSNGGLLMGVEFTQHPELWHAVDIQVPLLDMLRYEKIAAGSSWVGEYGSVSVPAERAFLAKISPYQNLRAGVKYPEPFIWTTTKDDRVGPQHARKFAAKLAELGDPYLFYEVTEGGHGSGANAKERSKTTALEYTYFIEKLMDVTKSAFDGRREVRKRFRA